MSIVGDRYFACSLSGEGLKALYRSKKIFVKRRQCMLPYELDTSGMTLSTQSLLLCFTSTHTKLTGNAFRSTIQGIGHSHSELVKLFKKYKVDKCFSGFAELCCSDSKSRRLTVL